MANFNLTSRYPALPVGYSFKGVVDHDDPNNFWLTVKLRRDVRVMGVTVHLPLASTVGNVDRTQRHMVPFTIEAMATRLMEDRLGVIR